MNILPLLAIISILKWLYGRVFRVDKLPSLFMVDIMMRYAFAGE